MADLTEPVRAQDPKLTVRLAASLIVSRHTRDGGRALLMGRRPRTAVFMPDKLVFPGGAVDPGDRSAAAPWPLSPGDEAILSAHVGPADVGALAAAAAREFVEETGLGLPPAPNASLVARAITPPGRTRRYDAWFFLLDAGAGDLPHRTRADGELEDVGWLPLPEIKADPLAEVTRFVLAQVEARLAVPSCITGPAFLREQDGAFLVTTLSADALS